MESVEVKMSVQQKEILVQFMEEHEAFGKGKLLGADGRKKKNELWEELTTRLNSSSGPQKTAAKWQRVWVDLKNKTKRKAAEIGRHRVTTGGGGPQSQSQLSNMEERIIGMMLTTQAIHGLQGPDGLTLDSAEPAGPAPGSSQPDATEVITLQLESPSGDDMSAEKYWQVRTPSTLGTSTLVSDDETRHMCSTPTPPPVKRARRQRTTAGQAAESFKRLGEGINKKVDHIVDTLNGLNNRMDTLISVMTEMSTERQITNDLLRELVSTLKAKR